MENTNYPELNRFKNTDIFYARVLSTEKTFKAKTNDYDVRIMDWKEKFLFSISKENFGEVFTTTGGLCAQYNREFFQRHELEINGRLKGWYDL